jgi:hypothetical protein
LKRIVVGLSSDKAMLHHVLRKSFEACSSSPACGTSPDDLEVAVCKACAAPCGSTARSTLTSPGAATQAELKQLIKDTCETWVCYSNGRVPVLLIREGWPINIKRTCKLYNGLGLQLRGKTPKRRARWFLTRDDARQKMEHQRRDYNEVRLTAPSATSRRYRS